MKTMEHPNYELPYPMQDDQSMREFEFDFALACNMLLGQTYEEALESAREWVKESRDEA